MTASDVLQLRTLSARTAALAVTCSSAPPCQRQTVPPAMASPCTASLSASRQRCTEPIWPWSCGGPWLNRCQLASFAPSHKLLAAFIDVVPSCTTAESKEMPDRRGHVATSMASEVFRKSLLGDQRTNRPLIVFLDGAFTLVARHADWGGRLLCVINDGAFHRSPRRPS
jgi:hypothetical protein